MADLNRILVPCMIHNNNDDDDDDDYDKREKKKYRNERCNGLVRYTHEC